MTRNTKKYHRKKQRQIGSRPDDGGSKATGGRRDDAGGNFVAGRIAINDFLSNISNSIRKTMKITKKKSTETTKMVCNPAMKDRPATETTCYTNAILIKIKRAYNKQHPENPIRTTNTKKLVQELKQRLMPRCKKEDCWLNLLPEAQREVLDKMVFATDQPEEWKENPKEWLSNYDMMNVLEQYEESYPNFRLLGPTPIDFDTRLKSGKCVWEEICHFSLKKYKNQGITDVAFIFNLDDHDESGSHWTSMYLSIPHKTLFYFDSAMNDTPKEVQVLVDRILEQAKELGISLTFQRNKSQHQFGNSECGMYSLFFIITLLTGKCGGLDKPIEFSSAINMFESGKIKDNHVFDFRNRYFNSN